MIKDIITDIDFLKNGCLSINTKNIDDSEMMKIVFDLLDTANHYNWSCVGLAANQIGYNKRIIVAKINNSFVAMVNPQINLYGKFIKKEEQGLSFTGKSIMRKRYNKVKVSYFCPINKIQVPCLKLKGIEARILQHEMDHLNGKNII